MTVVGGRERQARPAEGLLVRVNRLSTGTRSGSLGAMTETRIRVGRATDAERFLATDHAVWFLEVPAASTEEQLIGIPEELRFAADVDGCDPLTYAGIYGVFPLTLSIPGQDAGARQVPCAGLTWVGVHPDHRRKGVLTAMMRHHFEHVHEQDGTYVSALHASEPAIYGRHGYGRASLELAGEPVQRHDADRARSGGPGRRGHHPFRDVRIDPDVAKRMRECHLGCAGLGSVVGDADYYARICRPATRAPTGQGVLAGALRPPRHCRRRVCHVPPHAQVGACPSRRRAGGVGAGRRPGRPARAASSTGRLRPDRDGQDRHRRCRRPVAAVGRRPEIDVRRRDLRQPLGAPGRPPRGATGAGVERAL